MFCREMGAGVRGWLLMREKMHERANHPLTVRDDDGAFNCTKYRSRDALKGTSGHEGEGKICSYVLYYRREVKRWGERKIIYIPGCASPLFVPERKKETEPRSVTNKVHRTFQHKASTLFA